MLQSDSTGNPESKKPGARYRRVLNAEITLDYQRLTPDNPRQPGNEMG